MIQQLAQILTYIAMVAVPLAIIDDWFLRPHRRIAALPAAAEDPGWLKLFYALLPVPIIGSVINLMLSERLDFSLDLVIIISAAAVVWALDRFVLAPMRARAAAARQFKADQVALPVTVDYARSFLPVFLLVLVIRGFIFEPFRIPSDSMMPTLQDGDFIAVNKFAYGLRLPVLNRKVIPLGDPQRGDVVVFRYPPDPTQNYIKRLVGLPGDRVAVKNDQLIINGTPVVLERTGQFNDGCYSNMPLYYEQLGKHRHQMMACQTPGSISSPAVDACPRKIPVSYQCGDPIESSLGDAGDYDEHVIPAGEYLMMGDNRDNSADGRTWGYVPDANVVGRASRIWLNFSFRRKGLVQWQRIGQGID
jgi:signal peptidase I